MISVFRVGQRVILRVGRQKISTRIARCQGDRVYFSVASSVSLPQGTQCEMACTAPFGTVIYFMQVLRAPGEMGQHAILRRTPRVGVNHNRRGWRIPVSMNIGLRRNGAGEFVEGRLHNLGMEGALVSSPIRAVQGDGITLRICLPDEQPVLVGALVTRVAVPSASPGKQYSSPILGLEFTHMPKDSQRALTMFMWRYIREFHMQRKKERT